VPFVSDSQRKWMYAAAERGEVPKDMPHRWAHHTPDIKSLPEHKSKHNKDKGKHGAKHGPGCRRRRRKYAHMLPSLMDMLYDPAVKLAVPAMGQKPDVPAMGQKSAMGQKPDVPAMGQKPASSLCTESAPGPLRAPGMNTKHASCGRVPAGVPNVHAHVPNVHAHVPNVHAHVPDVRSRAPTSSLCTEGAPGPLWACMDKLAELALEAQNLQKRLVFQGKVTNGTKMSRIKKAQTPPGQQLNAQQQAWLAKQTSPAVRQRQLQIWAEQRRLGDLRNGYNPGMQSPSSGSPLSEKISPHVSVQPATDTYKPVDRSRMTMQERRRRADEYMRRRTAVDAASDTREDENTTKAPTLGAAPTYAPSTGGAVSGQTAPAQPQQSQPPPGGTGKGGEPGGGTARSGPVGNAPQVNPPAAADEAPALEMPQPQRLQSFMPMRPYPRYGMQQPGGYPTQPPPGPGRSWIYANPAMRPQSGRMSVPRGIGNFGMPQGTRGMPGIRGIGGFRKLGSPVGAGAGGGAMAGGGAPRAVVSGTVPGGSGGGSMGGQSGAPSGGQASAKPRGTTTGGANAQGTPAGPQTTPQGQQTAFQGQQGYYTPGGASFEHRLTPPPESKGVYIRPNPSKVKQGIAPSIGAGGYKYLGTYNRPNEKRANPVLGGLIGAGIGAMRAPEGHTAEGAGRGLGIGGATGLGVLGGGLAGLIPGLALQNPELAAVGGTLGAAGGGYGGFRLGRNIAGPPSWAVKKDRPEHEHKDKHHKGHAHEREHVKKSSSCFLEAAALRDLTFGHNSFGIKG
jgi:hypothetical protein